MNIQRISHTRCLTKLLRKVDINKCYSSTSAAEEKIEIPKRIPRGPTDILRALEATVSRDPTAGHYKYHDDPYLIPMSNIGKRSFALAQEAGRKAAHWIRKEHANLFQHKEAEPPIELFIPKVVYDEKSQVTEDDLKKLIKSAQVSDATLVYKILKEKGENVSEETRQGLLELLCFYNSEEPISEEFIEERWFRQTSKGKERQRNTWKDGSFPEELFISIENPSAEAYCAVIRGYAKHGQADRALQLFEEAQQKQIVLNTDVYNSLISVVHFLKESYEMRWTFIVDMLTAMKTAQLKPNLGTLNAVLGALSTMGIANVYKQHALNTLSEFKQLGIEPSLASWYYILITFCKERGPVSTILNDIMREVENKEHTIRDLKDTYFFITAMDICRNHLNDADLAKRVHNLLHYGSNYNLIGDSYKESIYYRHYFMVLCANELFEDFMRDTYSALVPHVYIPEPSVMAFIIKNIEISGSIAYVPRIWSDMVVFDHSDREELYTELLRIMVANPADTDDLRERFCNVAWDMFGVIENQNPARTKRLNFTGDFLGNVMIVALRNGDFDRASKVMEKLDKSHNEVVGVPSLDALSMFVDACIENKLPSRAINCIQYCSDSGFADATTLAARLNEKLTLDESHLNRLSKIFGDLAFVPAAAEQ